MNKILFFLLFITSTCFCQNIDYLTGKMNNLQSTSVNNLFIDRNTGQEMFNDYVNLYVKSGIDYNDLADSLFARMDEEPSDSLKFAISRMYDTLEYYGAVYNDNGVPASDSLDRFGCFAMHTEQAALLDWIRDTFCTAINSPLFKEYEGFTGDGLSAYINTNFKPIDNAINLSLNSLSAAIFTRTHDSENKFDLGVWNTISNRIQININYNGTTYGSLNSENLISKISPQVNGLYTISRENSLDCYIYVNDNILLTTTDATSSIPNYNVYIMAYNSQGTPLGFASRQYSFWFIGGYISSFLSAKIAEACEDFLDYFGKGVID
jgi:hypothetical protein